MEEINQIKENHNKLEESASNNNKKLAEEIKQIEENHNKLEGLASSNNTKLSEEINQIKENYNKLEEVSNNNNTKLIEEITAINTNIQKNEDIVNKLSNQITEANTAIKEDVKNNKNTIKKINEELKTQVEQLKLETATSYTKLETDVTENNKNWNLKLAEITKNLDGSQLEVENLANKITLDLEQTKEFATNENKKIEAEINEQIKNNDIENKASLKSLEETIEDMKNTMSISIDNLGQEVLKLKEEAKANLEKQDNNNTDVELLKKEHNKYVLKINSELSKISKAILNMQKKNLETSNNLQVKIKAYIDNKIEKASNTKNVEELINKLQLSILEKEKLQKVEMEQMLNKKIKEIQKENERILNKKIEELNNDFIRNKATFNTIKEERYEEFSNNKKNIYGLIDNKQILKRSAASKNPLDTTKEGKSQILKFFYDDDDLN